jgi:hypothetical protein
MLQGNNNRGDLLMKTTSIAKAAQLFTVLAVLAGTLGCSRSDDEMGPAQKAGAKIDSVGEQVVDQLHGQLDKADQAAKDVADAARANVDKIAEATNEASEGLSQATEEVGKKVERAGEKIQEQARD